MKVTRFWFLIFWFNFATSSTNETQRSHWSLLDLVEADLRYEDWTGETACYDQLMTTFAYARNFTLWATWVLDAIQLPIGAVYGSKFQLGNYDECLIPLWDQQRALTTKYCLADVRLVHSEPKKWTPQVDPNGSTENYISTFTKHQRDLRNITWGVCVPSVCKPHSVSKLVKILLQNSHLRPTAGQAVITVDECEVAETPYVYPASIRVFWYLLLSLLVIALCSTYCMAKQEGKLSESLILKIAKLFCMKKNSLDLVKENKGDIQVLHGARALSHIIIIYLHSTFKSITVPNGNGLDVDRAIDVFILAVHSDLITDSFLVMSGMLLMKNLTDKWDKPENPFLNLLKRYLRLVPMIAVMVFYMSSVSEHAGTGPVWGRLAGREAEMCRENGWLNFFMLNNYLNVHEMCYIILWYVPVDFQLHILGLVLFYAYHHDHRLGKILILVVSFSALVLPALATYWLRLPGLVFHNIKNLINLRDLPEFYIMYIRSEYRANTFLVGMALGYFVYVYKPRNYRKVISKNLSIIAFIISFIIAIAMMGLGGVFYTREYDVTEAVVYATVNRVIWAICLCTLIIVCEYGELPLVTGLLKWSPFVPLSRLSYGVYLTHAAIIMRTTYTTRTPINFDLFSLLIKSFGVTVFAYMISLIMWLLIQAPVSGLVNIAFNTRKPSASHQVQSMPFENSPTPSEFNQKVKLHSRNRRRRRHLKPVT